MISCMNGLKGVAMTVKEFLQDLLNADELSIKINGKDIEGSNVDKNVIMWQVHHDCVIDIWTD